MNATRHRSSLIVTPPNCTGCGLCANLCSQDAISMEWSQEGFLIPTVDEARCIECGLCIKRCVALEAPLNHQDELDSVEAYGAWNLDEAIQLSSSSGGIFTALAEQVFSQSGCVYGVIWQDKETASFTKAENSAQLAAMRGSKYTPALPDYVYRDVRDELKAGRHVLFAGTPCQVYALKKFLRKDAPHLLTLDIVCHGVPSRLILQKYIQEDEERTGKAIERIFFRDKRTSWNNYSVTRHYSDGTSDTCTHSRDSFMRMFLSDGALNRACYNCPFAHLPRPGDISAGDYWGVQNVHPNWPISKGISSVIANSEKGKAALRSLAENKTVNLQEDAFTNLYAGQPRSYLRQDAQIAPNRPYAMAALMEENCSLNEAIHQASGYTFIAGCRINNRWLPLRTLALFKIVRKIRVLIRKIRATS